VGAVTKAPVCSFRSELSLTSTHDVPGPAAAQRAQTPLFVEARGFLQPAVDFFSRAVSAAEQKESLTGKLLSSVSPYIMTEGRQGK
jgi:hypothetical protein